MTRLQLHRRLPYLSRLYHQRDAARNELEGLHKEAEGLRKEVEGLKREAAGLNRDLSLHAATKVDHQPKQTLVHFDPIEQASAESEIRAVEAFDVRRVAGEYWDTVRSSAPARARTAWWNDPPTIRHINRLVCGTPIDGDHAGFHLKLADYLQKTANGPVRALSVGSAEASKEMRVLKAGTVHAFDCYEPGPRACEEGRATAQREGFGDRLRFYNLDAFAADVPSDYDLVYWNNALHHMPDTAAAVQWSCDRLRPGGLFAMDDYVGATRFQHSPQLMAITNAIMATLPDRYLRRPSPDEGFVPRTLGLIDIDALIKIDPSEAMDSGNILPAIKRIFPEAEIITTGGALYFVALNDAFHNFESDEDLQVLHHLLEIDDAVSMLTETQYAVVFAVKPL